MITGSTYRRGRIIIAEKENAEAVRLNEEQKAEKRHEQSRNLVAGSIKRELAESMSLLFNKYSNTEAYALSQKNKRKGKMLMT